MNALQKLAQFSVSGKQGFLYDAWKRLSEKVGSHKRTVVSGVDGVTLSSFSANLEENLRSIAEELKAGKYHFAKLKPVFVEKPNGKDYRVICVPTIRDRITQIALQDFLSQGDPYKFDNGVSFGFIKGQGVETAIIRSIDLRDRLPFAYKTDIEKFFDTVNRTLLAAKLKKTVKHKSLHPILLKAISCEIRQLSGAEARKIKSTAIKPGQGVRQGMPLSPFFSNLVLSDFDIAMIKKKYAMVRYADDLIVFSKSHEGCQEAHQFCKDRLNLLGLSIPDIGTSKTKIFQPTEDAEFLGLALQMKSNGKYHCVVTKKQIEKIRDNILAYGNIDLLSKEKITITRYFKRLESVKSGYKAAYDVCSDQQKNHLFNQIDQWTANAKVGFYKNYLGLDLTNLSLEKKMFLEI